ncbi:unnamed protein product, partial [Ectocarpus sp. 12 AP-2014]
VGSLDGDDNDGDDGMDLGGSAGSGGSGRGDQDDSDGDDDPFDDDDVTAPTRQLAALTLADGTGNTTMGKKAKAAEEKKKKKAAASSTSSSSSSMSLAARVKHKFGDATTPAPKLPAKPTRTATRKPPSTYVDSSDDSGSDDDFDGMEVGPAVFQDEEVVAEPVMKPSRPGRAAAKNRKPIVDVISDDEEEEAGFDEDMGDSDDFHSAEENDSDDGYEPTPAKARK